jgi:IS1 family transposase
VNRLSPEDRAIILHSLCEGMSMRSCERVFKRPLKTIQKIIRDVGDWAIYFHGKEPTVTCDTLQADEIWSFVGENDRRTALQTDKDKSRGVCWTYLAVDRTTKLILTYHIGSRQVVDASRFMRKVEARLAKDDNGDYVSLPTIAVDGLKAYKDAIELAFGDRVNAGIFQKKYSKYDANGEPLPSSRYIGADRLILKGKPARDEINTWLIERENGFVRQANRRFTRKTNAFSKAMEFHERQVAITMVYRNYLWIPAPSRPKDGSDKWLKRVTPAMNAGLTDRVWTIQDIIDASDKYIATRDTALDTPPAEEVSNQAVAEYWVNHTPYQRKATVHLAKCSSCNGGTGKGKGPVATSIWMGFDTLDDAKARAAKLEPEDHRLCRLCVSSYNTLSSFGPRR